MGKTKLKKESVSSEQEVDSDEYDEESGSQDLGDA